MDLDSIADELYGLAPAAFTEARDAAATDARKAGDQVLAKSVSQLRKPTQAAWLVNLLVRAEPGEVEGLLALGEQLRAAQGALDGDEIRRLTQHRRTTLAALARTVESLAAEHGTTPSAAVARDVASTLEAAVADPEAGEALRTGRLTTAMSYAGFGGVDLDGVVATPRTREKRPEKRPEKRQEKRPAADAKPAKRTTPQSDRADRLAEARADLAQAQQRTAAAEADLSTATDTLHAAERRRTELEGRIAELDRAVAEARRAIATARRERDRAAKVVATARRQQETAEVRVNVFEA